MITSTEELEARKRDLETLPEDWYVDMDGSYASRPTQTAIDLACEAAARALAMGLVVEDVDPDANGGTCVDLRNEHYVEVHLYFSNGDKASLVAHSWCEMLTDTSWPKIQAWLQP